MLTTVLSVTQVEQPRAELLSVWGDSTFADVNVARGNLSTSQSKAANTLGSSPQP